MTWHIKRFPGGKEAVAHRDLRILIQQFESFAVQRTGASIFARVDEDGALAIYFPPIAADFARQAGALECIRPRRTKLRFLCGQPDTWDFYFGAGP